MKLPSEFREAVEQEQWNRSLSYLPFAEDLCGVPNRLLTLRMQLELGLARNPLIMRHRAVCVGDLFAFLWRLHPRFVRPVRPHLLRCSPRGRIRRILLLWLAFGRFSTALCYHALERHMLRVDLGRAINEVDERLAAWYQDVPPARDEKDGEKPLAPRRHTVDNLVVHFLTRTSMRWEEILDTPVALLYQLYRESVLAAGGEYIDGSSAGFSVWAARVESARRMGAAPPKGA